MGERQGLSGAKRCDVQVAPGAQLQGIASNAQGLPGLLPSPTSASVSSGPGRQVAEAQWGACPRGGCSGTRPAYWPHPGVPGTAAEAP